MTTRELQPRNSTWGGNPNVVSRDPTLISFLRGKDGAGELIVHIDSARHIIGGAHAMRLKQTLREIEREITTKT